MPALVCASPPARSARTLAEAGESAGELRGCESRGLMNSATVFSPSVLSSSVRPDREAPGAAQGNLLNHHGAAESRGGGVLASGSHSAGRGRRGVARWGLAGLSNGPRS